ncbi:MAG: hypothetical protein JWR80_6407 [Bradyrhizobium sp.]|nr:hypothetical protein [Bradyrhizobium sp.]
MHSPQSPQDAEQVAQHQAAQLVDVLKSRRAAAWSFSTGGFLVTVSREGDQAAQSYARSALTGARDMADHLARKVPPDVFHDPGQQSDG